MGLSGDVLDALDRHVRERPEQVVYRFLTTGDTDGPVVEWTYSQLSAQVSAVAKTLRGNVPPGSRCLLLFPPGLDFVAGFLGCLRAGVVAVPAYLPEADRQRPRALRRMLEVVRDCAAETVLTAPDDAGLRDRAGALDPAFARLGWLRRGQLEPATATAAVPPETTETTETADQVAFLQYTSGSTGSPKGVVVSHANLTHNLHSQHAAFRLDEAQMVSWLPVYHDMGLVAGLLYPLFVGGSATLMAPTAFIARPVRWLAALSRFGGTISFAPNFGYDLCLRSVSDAELVGLDLSAWAIAANGAEPVRGSTLQAFAERFAPFGLDPRAIAPSYGLAEATLFVTSACSGEWARAAAGLGPAGGTTSCGSPAPGTQVLLVDPETATPVPGGEVGEIWVRGPSNALGYWNRPQETEDTFGARLAGGDGPFLRTGDLGVLNADGLHIRGRRKDLIIIDGVNHYPQDVEQTVEECHPAVRPGCVAAFGVEVDDGERVVVAVETTGPTADLAAVLRAAVLREHQIPVHDVVLVQPRSIPKTSSGKIQRRETATRYRTGTLRVHAEPNQRAGGASATSEEVRAWLLAHLAALLGADVRHDEPFDRHGLVSRDVVALAVELTRWLGRSVTPSDVYGNPTVDALARHLTDGVAPAAPPRAAPDAADAVAGAVAVVGIGCRFPGADGPTAFWTLLRDGVEAIRDVPPDRWDLEAYFQAGGPAPGRMYTRRAGLLDDVAGFDAAFFGLSDTEARYLDPQQRLLLETAWAAMEDAGVPPAELAGSETGVYIGMTTGDYAQLMATAGVSAGPYAATGNVACMAANRVSYTFDLRGPSLTIDTACSSSLVAIHQACAAIRAGEISAALAGGVNLILSPLTTVALCQSGALSPDGRCYTFDSRANGYVRGEGAGLVLLKPLARALADDDRVYAVIRGSAVNQDGRSNGLTAPNPQAHARVIRKAYRNAGLDLGRMRYVEAHGTGTALGDPIEAGAVGMVLDGALPPGESCAIGSVKTNFGHLEPAAGAAGLIKVALALHHQQLPPSLHHETTNPHIDLDALRLRVPREAEPWPANGEQWVAGVNSFGVGGTNAHVVLQQAPPVAAVPPRPPSTPQPQPPPLPMPASGPTTEVETDAPRLLVLSGRTSAAVAGLAQRFAEFLAGADVSLAAVCRTAGLRRAHHEHRLAVVAWSAEDLARRLALGASAGVAGRARPGADSRIVFVFPGQGAQHVGMARGLYTHDPAFRAAFDECEQHMRPHLEWSPREQLLADEHSARIGEEEVVQPLLFAIQVALAATWRERGVRPDAVVGHSMGEVAAAHVAGVLSLADAAELTCVRARLLAELRGQGAMAVVGLHHADVRAELPSYQGRLHLAAANGPTLSVVSGDADAVVAFQASAQERGVFVRAVRASGAGHSPVVEPVAAAVARRFAGLRPKPAQIAMYSSVTGDLVTGDELTGEYWRRNLRDTVLFHPAVERIADAGHRLFLEMSPNPTLVVPVQQALDDLPGRLRLDGRAVGSLQRGRDDRESMLEAFGALHACGGAVDLRQVLPKKAPVVTLPTAPWQRRRHWFDGEAEPGGAGAAADVGRAVAEAFAGVLRVGDVAAEASFFELGGTSLMAAQMLYELRERLDREISLRLLFDHPTIAGFTRALESSQAGARTSGTHTPLTRTAAETFPLSFNQERVLRLDPRHYPRVVAQHVLIEGPLDVAALEGALQRIVEVHEDLGATFVEVEGGSRQQLRDQGTVVLPITDLSGSREQQRDLVSSLSAAEEVFLPFEGPMYRFRLTRLAPDRHALSFAVDHLISDGWSLGMLLLNLVRAYEARAAGQPDELDGPPLRFVDYAAWEREVYSGDYLRQRMEFWRTKLHGVRAPRPWFMDERDVDVSVQLRPRVVEQEIAEGQFARLEGLARATSTTMPMVVLTGLLLALRQHCGQDQIAVLVTMSGRERPELQRVVGWLSHGHLVDVDFSGSPTRHECLVRVRDAVLEADEQQGLSVSQYAYLGQIPNSGVPFRIGMNYMPDVEVPARLGTATVTALPRPLASYTLPRDVILFVRQGNQSLRLSFGYAAGIVDDDGMATFAIDMTTALDEVASKLDEPIEPLSTTPTALRTRQ